MSTKINYRCLTISAGEGSRYLDQEMGQHRRRYEVRVRSDATNVERRFTFHDSVHNEEQGKVGLSGRELHWAMYCFVSDALAGEMEYDEFLDEFGYDHDRDIAATWRACKDSARKIRDLFHAEPDLEDMANELQALGDG